MPLARAKAANFVPSAAGEHPRLLLRKSDIAALRSKAQTEWGKRLADELVE